MISKSAMGPQRQPAQRALSSTNNTPRLSPSQQNQQQAAQQQQQQQPQQQSQFPSPLRTHDAVGDTSLDGSEGSLSRYSSISLTNSVSKKVGSRLKLEISKETNDLMVESPRSLSLVGTPSFRPMPQRRGRPQLPFDLPPVPRDSQTASEGRSRSASPIKQLPLPVRPQHPIPPVVEKPRVVPAPPAKKEMRPKPYNLEVPAAAPRYSPNGHADFFPWVGNHPEDQFSDSVIRQGFFDKSQMTQNETGSAKAAIFPAMKHKNGLQTLSNLFTSVLAQRRAHGQIKSASTFKPPPRVTVTDTKREMWLKDLANPAISLRRLSRSIPHGIRGKVLLDQALSKNIPIERAVWLAKCVGANELRSFRRKGVSGTFAMGGEAKWIRDFTICVEQFVESVVGAVGEKDFQNKINYAIRLATYFYSELLLDREHYMDWILTSLENSNQAKLPVWLLIAQIYWKDLQRYRKYGRRLATALLSHQSVASTSPDLDIMAPLTDRLLALLTTFMQASPESFLSPDDWNQYKGTLLGKVEDDYVNYILEDIDGRNARLSTTGTERAFSSAQQLIRLLDTSISQPMRHELPHQGWHIAHDKRTLTRIVLDWATSLHRPGTAKIYVGVRVLRAWALFGTDTTADVLTFLDSDICETGRNRPALYLLISELARSDHFSSSAYFQWVIARGGLQGIADLADDAPCSLRLLAELPLSNLSEGMLGLRSTLLARVAYSTEGEYAQIQACMTFIVRSIPTLTEAVDFDPDEEEVFENITFAELVSNLSRTGKSDVGMWLRHTVRIHMGPMEHPSDRWNPALASKRAPPSAVTVPEFTLIRYYLEHMEDYSMLADVLKILSVNSNHEILACCADTLLRGMETFAAIGALRDICTLLLTRLQAMAEDVLPLPRGFLVSMTDLVMHAPDQGTAAHQLSQELIRMDRQTAADACSPISDHMIGVLQTAEADFNDEIERVFSTGTSMDAPTLDNLFQRIVQRMEDVWVKSPENQRSCGLLLTRLRTFDSHQFDLRMTTWVRGFLEMEVRPTMMQALGPLISFDCLSLHTIIGQCASIIEERTTTGKKTRPFLAIEALALLQASPDLPDVLGPEESYRLGIKQIYIQKEGPTEVLYIVRHALEEAMCAEDEHKAHITLSAQNLLNCSATQELLQRIVIRDPDAANRTLVFPLIDSPNPKLVIAVKRVIDGLIVPDGAGLLNDEFPIATVLSRANDLTLPFCQLKLESIFRPQNGTQAEKDERMAETLKAFDQAIETAVANGNTAWSALIPLLDIPIVQHLRRCAVSRFIALFPTPRHDAAELLKSNGLQQAAHLLHIIDATSFSMPANAPGEQASNAALASDIATALQNFLEFITPVTDAEVKEKLIRQWLPLLLSFTTFSHSVFEATRQGHEFRSRALLALGGLVLELDRLLSLSVDVAGLNLQVFDVAILLVDSLSEEMRQFCIRSLHLSMSHPWLCYIFSCTTHLQEWLFVSHREKGAAKPGSVAETRAAASKEKLTPYQLRRWEMLGEPTPNVGENDTSLSLTLFAARKC